MKLRLLVAGLLASLVGGDWGLFEPEGDVRRSSSPPPTHVVRTGSIPRVVTPSGRNSVEITGSRPAGWGAQGPHFYIWDEDRLFAYEWAVELASLEVPAPGTEPQR